MLVSSRSKEVAERLLHPTGKVGQKSDGLRGRELVGRALKRDAEALATARYRENGSVLGTHLDGVDGGIPQVAQQYGGGLVGGDNSAEMTV